MTISSSYRPYSGKQPRQSKPRPYWSRYGKGREEYAKEQEEQQEKDEYFNSLEAERTLPASVVQNLREFNEKDIDIDLIFNLMRYISTSMGEGAILVFLPGWDTITKLNDMLMANPVFRSSNYLIIPLHSMMPTAFQQKVRIAGTNSDPSLTKFKHLQWYSRLFGGGSNRNSTVIR